MLWLEGLSNLCRLSEGLGFVQSRRGEWARGKQSSGGAWRRRGSQAGIIGERQFQLVDRMKLPSVGRLQVSLEQDILRLRVAQDGKMELIA